MRAEQEKIYHTRMAQVAKDAWAGLQGLGEAVSGNAFNAREEAARFFASAGREMRAPEKSMRFYPPPFEVYLRSWEGYLVDALRNL